MNIRHDQHEDLGNVWLEGELTIYHVDVVKQSLLDFLDSSSTLNVYLDQVSEIDTAGMQVLIAVKQEAARLDKRLILMEHSACVLEMIELFGLTGFFGDPVLLKS
ncbi:hypothetical protein A9404_02125 [Halothiobacillus diazotrophicus]|uniref:STAS domain-containing protein n=1 Tax=Halothiobacillus diazotrophicus TaxID=1860122 RepID=A0A191ZEP9_9GAMM|nr:STAS domain-containing protein [Halothiobacillus diazotrophicus]ANJ66335.1 hypothetical protein A9404_02125 [Halothiobacillus diazotrophicus]